MMYNKPVLPRRWCQFMWFRLDFEYNWFVGNFTFKPLPLFWHAGCLSSLPIPYLAKFLSCISYFKFTSQNREWLSSYNLKFYSLAVVNSRRLHVKIRSLNNALQLKFIWGLLCLVICHIKSTNGGYQELKGFLIWSTYGWEKGYITIVSNFWTHCTNHQGYNQRSHSHNKIGSGGLPT